MTTPQRTETVTIPMEDGKAIPFELAVGDPRPAMFCLGVRKSGSSIFSNVCTAIGRANAINVVDVPGAMFERGYIYKAWNDNPRTVDLVRPGNMYVGFRNAPTVLYNHPAFRESRKILLVRDPRDALVSEYFSNAYSHSLPAENADASLIAKERAKALQASLEEYVRKRVRPLENTVAAYLPLLEDPNTLVLRYEDVILEKASWIRDIASHFGLAADDMLVKNIISWADVRPESEDPTRFIRRVTPGDHLDKLTPETIATINAGLGPVWPRLGYTV